MDGPQPNASRNEIENIRNAIKKQQSGDTSTMKTLTLKLPNELHKKVCKLAAIAHRPVAQLALKEIEALASQGHDERDLDFIIPCFIYRTKKTALKVALAANAFTARKSDDYDAVGPDENGNFSVLPQEDRARAAIDQVTKQVEIARASGVTNIIPLQVSDCREREIPPIPPAA